MVGRVGVEPTHPGGTDLQSAAPLRLRRLPILNQIQSNQIIFSSIYFVNANTISPVDQTSFSILLGVALARSVGVEPTSSRS